jgi:hypothetical protein
LYLPADSVFLDNIKNELHQDPKPFLIPRLSRYTFKRITDLLGDDYEKINFKSWEDTCYANRGSVEEYTEPTAKKAGKKRKEAPPAIGQGQDSRDCHHDRMLADLTSRDRAQLYQEHVLDRTRDTVKLDILDHVVVEKYFVECFKPGGYMHSNIFFLQSLLWNREWKGKYILSEKASVSTLILFFFSYP